ncbi:MAG: hypothetical protein JO073_03665 [Actinobacteria bacterium]|nr:hypothetical protein [Actinomycetota bacterium]
MSRKRWIMAAALVVAAVAAAGAGAAAHRAQSSQKAAATFSAGSPTDSRTATCTASDGTYSETVATYTGTSTSTDARLNGALRIRAHSVVDTTTGLGWVTGDFRVDGSSGGVHGQLAGVISGGNVSGTVAGDANGPDGKLLATLTAAFTQAAGFSSGSLGTGSVAGAGIVFQRGECTSTKQDHSVYVSQLHLNAGEVVPPSSSKGHAEGSFTLDVTRDSTGAITGGTAVFYVNYRFPGSVTINGLTLNQGAKGSTGPTTLDSGVTSFTDADGNGNLTKVVSGVSAATAQAILSTPNGYYVQLSTADGGLRDQLGGFARR